MIITEQRIELYGESLDDDGDVRPEQTLFCLKAIATRNEHRKVEEIIGESIFATVIHGQWSGDDDLLSFEVKTENQKLFNIIGGNTSQCEGFIEWFRRTHEFKA